jgi:5-methylcytosine-specific restriction protein A
MAPPHVTTNSAIVGVRPPWIHPPHALMTKRESESRGNKSVNHSEYNDNTWRKYSKSFLAKNRICVCGCGKLATVTDHAIPINQGGSKWDVRNHQPMASVCHDRKSGREAHGKVEEWIQTDHGKIPSRNASLPMRLGNEGYMLNKK